MPPCNPVGTASAKRFHEARYKHKVASPTQHGSINEKDILNPTLAEVQGRRNLKFYSLRHFLAVHSQDQPREEKREGQLTVLSSSTVNSCQWFPFLPREFSQSPRNESNDARLLQEYQACTDMRISVDMNLGTDRQTTAICLQTA